MFKTLMEYRPLIVAWIWICLAIPAFLWWQESLPFLVAMSLYANIEASFSTYASKKEERNVEADLRKIKQELGIHD